MLKMLLRIISVKRLFFLAGVAPYVYAFYAVKATDTASTVLEDSHWTLLTYLVLIPVFLAITWIMLYIAKSRIKEYSCRARLAGIGRKIKTNNEAEAYQYFIDQNITLHKVKAKFVTPESLRQLADQMEKNNGHGR